jgi:O-antigen/teichoic acid export membrane protein
MEWGRLITISGSAQVLIQFFSLISGILVIRLLPTGEYALYTLTNTMLGTMILLADGGISDGVLSQGGKAWSDRNWLGAVVATGLDLRKKFAAGSLAVAVPLLTYLLHLHGADPLMTAVLILSIIPSFYLALSGNIFEIAPKLRQDILPLQKNQVALNTGRFGILCLTLFIFPFSYVAILAGAIPQLWTNLRLRKLSSRYASSDRRPDPVVRKDILKIVKRTMPGAVYYCFSGQITTWLISIFGSTESLAKIGALSRFSMVLNVFTTLSGILVIPRFARLATSRKLLITRFSQIQVCLLTVSVLITGTVFVFPGQLLFLLGKNYTSLTTEVVIIAAGSCIGMMEGITYNLLLSRGLVLHPVISITCNILTQLTLLHFLDLSNVQDLLWFQVINNSAGFLLLSCFGSYSLLKTAGS